MVLMIVLLAVAVVLFLAAIAAAMCIRQRQLKSRLMSRQNFIPLHAYNVQPAFAAGERERQEGVGSVAVIDAGDRIADV
jgi:hypothetical protein